MTKKTITKMEYYQLLGLLKIAHDLDKQLDIIAESMAKIIGQKSETNNYWGMVSDICFDVDDTVDDLLKNLQISVKDN